MQTPVELLDQYLEIFYRKYKAHYSIYYKKTKGIRNSVRSRSTSKSTSKSKYKKNDILDNAINLRLDNIYKYFEQKKPINMELNKLLIKPLLDEYSEFIKDMLNKSLSVKMDNNKIDKQINAIIYNGNPLVNNNVHVVPDGCILVILTPIGRYGIQITDLYEQLIKNLNNSKYNNFMNNPVCYKRNELHGIYSDASIYFPGQYYTDISLISESEPENNMYNYWGFYKVELNRKDLDPQSKRDSSIDKITLSKLIKEQDMKGVIFVHCCRSIILDHARYKDDQYLQHTVIMKQYETFIKILNKCVYISKPDNHTHRSNKIILSDEDYENCDNITMFEPIISSKAKKPIDYFRKLSNTAKIASYQKNIQPELNKLSQRFTNANSETMATLLRIINGLKPLMNTKIIKYINAWLYKNNPATTDMKQLFKVMNKYFTKIIKPDEITHYLGLVHFLKYSSKIQKLRNIVDKNFLNIIDIIMSYCIYSKLKHKIKSMKSMTSDFTNIIVKLLGTLQNGNGNLFNIFLNGLKLTTSDFIYMPALFVNISGDIYLRNNRLIGIPQSWIIYSSSDNQVICSYKVLDITGNENINFHLAESDGVKLANIDFFKNNSQLIESHNPEFMSYMSGLFDQLGLSLLDSK
jgi:hypothetical protein